MNGSQEFGCSTQSLQPSFKGDDIRTRGVRGSIRSFLCALGLFTLVAVACGIVAELTSVMARHGHLLFSR